MRRLNKISPNFDPFGTPPRISRYELRDDPIFTRLRQFVRQSVVNAKAVLPKPYAASFALRRSFGKQTYT